jgi:predicted nucleotidyltransferase
LHQRLGRSPARPADRKLAEFLDRVRALNASDYYLYRVRRVLVFGSYLTSKDRLNDVDVAVDVVHRLEGHEVRAEADMARGRKAAEAGRQFSSFLAEMSWAYNESLLFLKARSRAISLHTTDDAILDHAPSRLVFEASDTPPWREVSS